MPPAKLPRAVSAVARAAKDLEKAVGNLTQAVATTYNPELIDADQITILEKARSTVDNALAWIERNLDVRAQAMRRQEVIKAEAKEAEAPVT